MKRIVKLTERDLTRIVKRVINESFFFKGNSNWDNFNSRRKRPHIRSREDEDIAGPSVHDVTQYFFGMDLSDDDLSSTDKEKAFKVLRATTNQGVELLDLPKDIDKALFVINSEENDDFDY